MSDFTRQSLGCDTDGGTFCFERDGDAARLVTPHGEVVELSVKDWDVVCQAFQRLCGSVGAEKPNHAGEPWTEELDRLLAKKWAEGETVAKIALAMGRTNGSIASRLERLDIVADRAEASRRK